MGYLWFYWYFSFPSLASWYHEKYRDTMGDLLCDWGIFHLLLHPDSIWDPEVIEAFSLRHNTMTNLGVNGEFLYLYLNRDILRDLGVIGRYMYLPLYHDTVRDLGVIRGFFYSPLHYDTMRDLEVIWGFFHLPLHHDTMRELDGVVGFS